MRVILTTAAATLAIATAACQKPADTNDDVTANNTAMSDTMNEGMANDMAMNQSMSGAPMAASEFAATIAGSDMYELASGKLAQTMATNPQLKEFGGMLVADHTKSTAELKTAAAAATPPVTLPTAMPAEMQTKVDALKAAKGAEFDRLFLEQQKQGHQTALDTLKSYAAGGDAPSLKAFADKTAPVVQSHLDALNAMKI